MFDTQVDLDTTAYQVLGVSESATQDDINKAHRALMRKFHPDLNPNADPEKVKAVSAAYDKVKNADARASYDFTLRDARKAAEPETTVPAPTFTAPAAHTAAPTAEASSFTPAGEQFDYADTATNTRSLFGNGRARLIARLVSVAGIIGALFTLLTVNGTTLGGFAVPVWALAIATLVLLVKRPTVLVMGVLFGAIIAPASLTGLGLFTFFTHGATPTPFIAITALAVFVGGVVLTKKARIA